MADQVAMLSSSRPWGPLKASEGESDILNESG